MHGLHEYDVRLQYHQKLNPALWWGQYLRSEVRDRLLAAANKWIEFARVPKAAVKDVVITGGNVNYNWTPYSDIDVHVIADRTSVGAGPLTDDYLKSKKKLWSLTHHIEIHGYPLEMYVQDPTEKSPPGQGVYSIRDKRWVQKPMLGHYDFENDEKLKRKAEHYSGLIQKLINTNAPVSDFEALKERLAAMRANAIASGGEFSRGNLTFKSLRNNGLFDLMLNYIRKSEDEALSLRKARA